MYMTSPVIASSLNSLYSLKGIGFIPVNVSANDTPEVPGISYPIVSNQYFSSFGQFNFLNPDS